MAHDPLPASAEIVIVGAGVIGLTLALALQQQGRQTLVLERAQPGAGASRVAGGLLAPATAHYLAEWIISGRPAPQLEPFAVERLARPSAPAPLPGHYRSASGSEP